LYTCSPPYSEQDEKWLRHADLIVALPGGPAVTDFRPADTLSLENPAEVIPRVLAHRSDLRVALGRRLPGFRKTAADALVKDVSRANTEFAIVAGVSKFLPHLLPFFPLLSVADTFILTKNQVFMLFRLAAIYGEEPNLKERAMETVPIIGGAFGWRQVARMAAGAIPGPLGLPLKAAVAFSGTYAVGRAAEIYFEQDRRPSADEMKRIFEEGKRLGVEVAAKLLRKKEKPAEPPPPAVVEEHPAALSEGSASADSPAQSDLSEPAGTEEQ
jgi:uncharacterized protein (DUF697 family)